jgi:hypothetical protein
MQFYSNLTRPNRIYSLYKHSKTIYGVSNFEKKKVHIFVRKQYGGNRWKISKGSETYFEGLICAKPRRLGRS